MINNSACLWIGTTNNSYYSEFQALTSIIEKFIVLIIFADYGVPCQKPVSGFQRTWTYGNKPYCRCSHQAALTAAIKLCEESPDGKENCTTAGNKSSIKLD